MSTKADRRFNCKHVMMPVKFIGHGHIPCDMRQPTVTVNRGVDERAAIEEQLDTDE